MWVRIAALAVLSLAAAGPCGPAMAMTYRLVPTESPRCGARCPAVIAAEGMIEKDEEAAFSAFASSQPEGSFGRTLLIGSLGGYGVGGVKLGYLLRQLGFTVVVGQAGEDDSGRPGIAPAVCASACVFVLAGGVRRSVAPGSIVGVHRPYAGGQVRDVLGGGSINAELNYEALERALAAFFKLMGVDPRLSALSMKTPSNSVHVLTRKELARYRLTTRRG